MTTAIQQGITKIKKKTMKWQEEHLVGLRSFT